MITLIFLITLFQIITFYNNELFPEVLPDSRTGYKIIDVIDEKTVIVDCGKLNNINNNAVFLIFDSSVTLYDKSSQSFIGVVQVIKLYEGKCICSGIVLKKDKNLQIGQIAVLKKSKKQVEPYVKSKKKVKLEQHKKRLREYYPNSLLYNTTMNISVSENIHINKYFLTLNPIIKFIKHYPNFKFNIKVAPHYNNDYDTGKRYYNVDFMFSVGTPLSFLIRRNLRLGTEFNLFFFVTSNHCYNQFDSKELNIKSGDEIVQDMIYSVYRNVNSEIIGLILISRIYFLILSKKGNSIYIGYRLLLTNRYSSDFSHNVFFEEYLNTLYLAYKCFIYKKKISLKIEFDLDYFRFINYQHIELKDGKYIFYDQPKYSYKNYLLNRLNTIFYFKLTKYWLIKIGVSLFLSFPFERKFNFTEDTGVNFEAGTILTFF